MKFTSHPLSLLAALALGWFAQATVSAHRSPGVPAAANAVQAFPLGGTDASVPTASTVTFPVADTAAAPTF